MALSTMLITSMNVAVFANTVTPINPSVVVEQNVPRADVIVTYHRVHNGQLQIRKWNETRGYWVDEWTDIGTPAG